MLVEKTKRSFLKSDFSISDWNKLEPYYTDLVLRKIESLEEFETWLAHWNELDSAIEEEYAWTYIHMTIDTSNEEASGKYAHLTSEITPKLTPLANDLNKKLDSSPYKNQLTGEANSIWLKNVKSSLELFREENISINSEIQALTQKYGALSGGMKVTIKGQEMTIPAAAAELQSANRDERQEAYNAVNKERLKSKSEINGIFNKLVKKRNQIALNTDFSDFRDYKFKSLGRWDFTKKDCFDFHDSVAKEVSPLVKKLYENKKESLGLNSLKPWDTSAPAPGKLPLKPFGTEKELIEKSINIFNKLDPYFGEALSDMKKLGHLDLSSKPGKSPGGYNYPLYESGAPFIFMNAVGTPRDLVTMMHEGGHAVHSFLTHNLKYSVFKSCPSEVAELASMSMELMSMDYWDEFYTNPEELKQAKKEHLEDSIMALPWIAMVDKFQHWIYENPNHTEDERESEWIRINDWLGNTGVDWSGLEEVKANTWQKQLHIFELPFYYIEYGMAQLGAIAMWKNYKEDKEKTIQDYKTALSLGYTKSVPEIYKAAGIKFDFSTSYIKELMDFMQSELQKI